jgi:HNH endonuclease
MTAIHPSTPGVRYKSRVGFLGYCIGDDGSIWSRYRKGQTRPIYEWKRLKPSEHGQHSTVMLRRDGGGTVRFAVHILVLEAFDRLRPAGLWGLHDDDNPRNNHISNLRWGTPSDNSYDAVKNRRVLIGADAVWAKLTEADVLAIRDAVAAGERASDIAARFPIGEGYVSTIAAGRRWAHLEDKKVIYDRHRHMKRGEAVVTAKLREGDVVTIRQMVASGLTTTALARKFGVSRRTIGRIVKGESWAHV